MDSTDGLQSPSARAATRARILLVDDEAAILRAYSRALARAGYEVDTAPTGEHAREMIEGTHYAVLLPALSRPGIGGLGAVTAVRQRNATTRIIVWSGATEDEDRARAAGAHYFLVK